MSFKNLIPLPYVLLMVFCPSCNIEMWENTPTQDVFKSTTVRECERNRDCEGDLICNNAVMPYRCQAKGQDGAECRTRNECESGLVCNNLHQPSICTPLYIGEAGDDCRYDNHCAEDLICYPPGGVDVGLCGLPGLNQDGEPCYLDHHCGDGLVCDPTLHCVPCGKLGQPFENEPIYCTDDLLVPLSLYFEEYNLRRCRLVLSDLPGYCLLNSNYPGCYETEGQYFNGDNCTFQEPSSVVIQDGNSELECTVGCRPECEDDYQTYSFSCNLCEQDSDCEETHKCLFTEHGNKACIREQCANCREDHAWWCFYADNIEAEELEELTWCILKQCECPGEDFPCYGNGICEQDATCTCDDEHWGEDCKCEFGFRGELCELECPGGAGNPCSSHGTCSETAECECDDGYIGIACECPGKALPCYGNGICEQDTTCTCNDGYWGDCKCEFGFRGELCELECPGGAGNPCNSHGTCSETAECECGDGYTGLACEEEL